MLKSLKLENFVLIDACTIEFGPRLNVITGETGHGKTLLAKALYLTLGERADTALIRNGEETATIEALFDLEKDSPAISLLENAGVPCNDPLIIRRTIDRNGKNKLFINSCATPLIVLQNIAPYLIEIVGQQTSLKLKEKANQRVTLDTYGNISTNSYQTTYTKLQLVKNQRDTLLSKKEYYDRELPRLQKELEEIEEIDPQENEEDELFQKQQELTKKHDASAACRESNDDLTEILSRLANLKQHLPDDLEEIAAHVQAASIELAEASYTLEKHLSDLSVSPHELDQINDRLTTVHRLNRKYDGQLETAYEKLLQEVSDASNFEQTLHELDTEIASLTNSLTKESKVITEKRIATAKDLSTKITDLLQDLEMAGSLFTIKITPIAPTTAGTDDITYLWRANPGETTSPLTKSASGGELSRLLFALKLLTATSPILFDEIDSNIGGKTARKIAEKLQSLPAQTLTISHFPQMAQAADTHLKIVKETTSGRTSTIIKPLTAPEKSTELLRMLGGKEILPT